MLKIYSTKKFFDQNNIFFEKWNYHGIECFFIDELNTNGEITILDDNEAFIIEENRH